MPNPGPFEGFPWILGRGFHRKIEFKNIAKYHVLEHFLQNSNHKH